MEGFKLFTQRADGSLGPLFINKRQVVPVGEWLDAECHPTKGFQVNKGWHACSVPEAPHLSLRPKGQRPRVWCRVEVAGRIKRRQRPMSQGGAWILAERMRVIEVLPELPGLTLESVER